MNPCRLACFCIVTNAATACTSSVTAAVVVVKEGPAVVEVEGEGPEGPFTCTGEGVEDGEEEREQVGDAGGLYVRSVTDVEEDSDGIDGGIDGGRGAVELEDDE
jgi:hypothetical protein